LVAAAAGGWAGAAAGARGRRRRRTSDSIIGQEASRMAAVITPEYPASPDATALIAELDAHLEPLYARESRHGFGVQKLIADAVTFFVVRDDVVPAGCGGIKLFGTEYGEIKRMWVRPQFRGLVSAS